MWEIKQAQRTATVPAASGHPDRGTGAKSKEGNGKNHTKLPALKRALMANISPHSPLRLFYSLRHEREGYRDWYWQGGFLSAAEVERGRMLGWERCPAPGAGAECWGQDCVWKGSHRAGLSPGHPHLQARRAQTAPRLVLGGYYPVKFAAAPRKVY